MSHPMDSIATHSPLLRLACIRVPLFPLAARLRAEPELRDEAVVVVEGNGHVARVLAASRAARRAGVKSGLTLPQARALLPRLVTRTRDAVCERAAQETLLEVAERFSPQVEDASDGCVYLDARGTTFVLTAADPERELALSLQRECDRLGLPGGVGIAGSKLAARIAASLPRSPHVIAAGAEGALLSPLPLQRLAPELEVAEALARWGIRTIGELAALPAAEVASRLGTAGQRLHAAARGLDPTPLESRPPPTSFAEGMELEWPLTSLEPFLFIARAALDRLCCRLEARGLGCARLELSLRLEPDGYVDRELALPAPTRDSRTLLTLVRLDLERHPPGAPVVGFRLAAQPDRPQRAQLALFGSPAISPDRLATTLARLFTLLGEDRVGSPRVPDGHRPERFLLVPYAPPPPPKLPPKKSLARGLMAVRMLRPPLPLSVEPGDEGTPPVAPVALRSQEEEGTKPRIEGRVRVASGPWELEERWWSAEDAVDREYWDVELAGGGLYRIYRDRRSGSWFADGAYD